MNDTPSSSDQVRSGTVIDRYRIVRRLGEGGMAEVFLAEHIELGTLHALKVLRAGLAAAHARLMQEGRLQASLSHENVVAMTDVIPFGNARALVMEYVDGPELHDLLRWYQPTMLQCDHLARQILMGVASAHEQGLIHRDIKPSNVLIAIGQESVTAKVADFGLAKDIDGELSMSRTRSGTTMGTPLYMAPEQFRNAKYADRRADVFSLGALLYELLTGLQAFSGEDLIEIYTQTAHRGYRPLREVLPQVPTRMERAIDGALDPDRESRLQTVQALLETWTDGTPAPEGQWEAPHLELLRAAHTKVRESRASVPPTVDVVEEAEAPSPPTPEPPAAPASRSRWASRLAMLGLVVPAGLALGLCTGAAATVATWQEEPVVTAPVQPPPPEPTPEPLPERAPVLDAGPGWTWQAGTRFTFGDDSLHVPPDILKREYNWPGRTIGNRNPGYPFIPTSPEHPLELGGFAFTRPLTWRDWEKLGGRAQGEPDALATGVPLYQIEKILNKRSQELGLQPAMQEGSWNGADGLRLPTEAEWELLAIQHGAPPDLELVLDPEPTPTVPARGKPVQVLRGRAERGRTFKWRETPEGAFRLVSTHSELKPTD